MTTRRAVSPSAPPLRLTRLATLALCATAFSGLSAASLHGVGKTDASATPLCYVEVAEDGSADLWCDPETTARSSWPAGTVPADGQWHSCPLGVDNGDPACGSVAALVTSGGTVSPLTTGQPDPTFSADLTSWRASHFTAPWPTVPTPGECYVIDEGEAVDPLATTLAWCDSHRDVWEAEL